MNLQRVVNILLLAGLLLALFVLGKQVFMPIAFAIMFAFLMYPIVKKLETKLPRVLSISIVFIGVTAVVSGIACVIYFSLTDIVQSMDDIGGITQDFINASVNWISEISGIERNDIKETLGEDVLQEPLQGLSTQLLESSTIVFNAMITGILTFLFLLYRTVFKHFIQSQVHKTNRNSIIELFQEMQQVAQQYLQGIFFTMLVLGILNSLGLLLIGVKYAFFWGFLAAFLTLIPYVGTFIGGFLPFVFALGTMPTFWQPVAVIFLFATIQFLEDAVIKPKIVGKQVDLNPIVAILALIVGGMIWGIAGLILALPYTALLKIVLEQFEETEALATAMGSDVYDKPEVFKEQYAKPKYSISHLFKKPEK